MPATRASAARLSGRAVGAAPPRRLGANWWRVQGRAADDVENAAEEPSDDEGIGAIACAARRCLAWVPLRRLQEVAAALRSAQAWGSVDEPDDACALNAGAHGCVIADASLRGVTLEQLRRLRTYAAERCHASGWGAEDGERLRPGALTTRDVVDRVLRPATRLRRCSFVELVASAAQPPTWFVSHWWGEPLARFLACLTQHASDRCLGADAAYWVLVCAISPWSPPASDGEFSETEEFAWKRAMELAVGTVSVVDADALYYTRLWCAYEAYASFMVEAEGRPYMYDIYTALGQEDAVGLTDGFCERDAEEGRKEEWDIPQGAAGRKLCREARFPLSVAAKALQVRIGHAETADESDRKRILHALAGSTACVKSPVEEGHAAYDAIGAAIRWRSSLAIYPSAVERGEAGALGLLDVREPEGWSERAARVCLDKSRSWAACGRCDLAGFFGERAMFAGERTVAAFSQHLAALREREGEHAEALALQEKVLALTLRDPYNKSALASTYLSLAALHGLLGAHELALELRGKALSTLMNEYGEHHSLVEPTCSKLALELCQRYGCETSPYVSGQALSILDIAIGDSPSVAAASYNAIASAMCAQGSYGQAVAMYEGVLAIHTKRAGEHHEDHGLVDVAVAISHGVRDLDSMPANDGAAWKFCKDALPIRTDQLGIKPKAVRSEPLWTKQMDIAATYVRIAGAHANRGSYDEALAAYDKARSILEKTLGEDHSEVAAVHSGIAQIRQVRGDVDLALEHNEKALAISLRVFGRDSLVIASTYSCMAGLRESQGDQERALELYTRALAIELATLGDAHPDVAKRYGDIAALHTARCQHGFALECQEKACAVEVKAFGDEHTKVASRYTSMAALCCKQGEHERALELYLKALAIRLGALGEEHPDVAALYNNMAMVHKSAGSYDQAMALFERALDIFSAALGSEHVAVGTVHDNMARVCYERGDYDRAFGFFRRTMAIFAAALGEDHPHVASTYENMIHLIRKQGDDRLWTL